MRTLALLALGLLLTALWGWASEIWAFWGTLLIASLLLDAVAFMQWLLGRPDAPRPD